MASTSNVYDRLADLCYGAWGVEDRETCQRICDLVPGDASIGLDLGCGHGTLLGRLCVQRPNVSWTGVDLSEKCVQRAQRLLGLVAATQPTTPRWEILCGDWISAYPLDRPSADVVIVKNALHLLEHPVGRLRELWIRMSENARLILCETVSPSERANEWAVQLFRQMDNASVKRVVWTCETLDAVARYARWRIRLLQTVDERIDVQVWLASKCTDPVRRRAAEQLFAQAPAGVAEDLQFDPPGQPLPDRMLRRQRILYCVPEGSTVDPAPRT